MKDNQVTKTRGLSRLFKAVEAPSVDLAMLLGKRVNIKDVSIDMDLPIYHLPDGKVHIGFNPPKPYEMGYGVDDD